MSKSSYTIENVDGVLLVWSTTGVPIAAMSSILKLAPAKAVMDIGLSSRIGAAMAIGLPSDLEAYRKSGPAACEKVQRQVKMAATSYTGKELEEITVYLDGYDRGQSADALLQITTGVECANDPRAYPRDLGDLGRCVRLFRACQAVRENFIKAATISETWRAIVDNWDQKLASVDSAPTRAPAPDAPGQAA